MIWKQVVGFEGIYSVSIDGQIRRDKPAPHTRPGLILKRRYDKDGYVRHTLKNGVIIKNMLLHRIIYEAFVDKIPHGMQINHKNGIKDDNRLENLEVVTPSENTAHGFRVLGRKPQLNPNPGTRNGRAKLTDDQVREIRQLYSEGGISQQKIADQFGINQTIVSGIVLRKYWRHIA